MTQGHDIPLLLLAVAVSALASVAVFSLLHHARQSEGRMRGLWLAITALSGGLGHLGHPFHCHARFLARHAEQLQYCAHPDLAGRRDRPDRHGLYRCAVAHAAGRRLVGGAMVGGGIAVMHYTGMAAFEFPGPHRLGPTLVATSITAGALIRRQPTGSA